MLDLSASSLPPRMGLLMHRGLLRILLFLLLSPNARLGQLLGKADFSRRNASLGKKNGTRGQRGQCCPRGSRWSVAQGIGAGSPARSHASATSGPRRHLAGTGSEHELWERVFGSVSRAGLGPRRQGRVPSPMEDSLCRSASARTTAGGYTTFRTGA